jgi:hypothetical protein
VATQACLYYQMCCVANNSNHVYQPTSSVPSSMRGSIQQTYSADVTVNLREKSIGNAGAIYANSAVAGSNSRSKGEMSPRDGKGSAGVGGVGGGMGDDARARQEQQDEEGHEHKRTSTMSGYPGYHANPERVSTLAGAAASQARSGSKSSAVEGGSGKGSMYQRTYHSEGQLPTINVPTVPSSVRSVISPALGDALVRPCAFTTGACAASVLTVLCFPDAPGSRPR